MLGSQLNVAIGTQAALSILGDVATGLTAAGTSQATAYAISATTNAFTTVASGTGALLPGSSAAGAGDEIYVGNFGANSLMVYPPSGGKLNSGNANVGAVIPPGKSALFKCLDATNYLALFSA